MVIQQPIFSIAFIHVALWGLTFYLWVFQADVETDVAAAGQPKKRTFKKFSFRGVDLDALLDMSTDELVKLFPARARRRYTLRFFKDLMFFFFWVFGGRRV